METILSLVFVLFLWLRGNDPTDVDKASLADLGAEYAVDYELKSSVSGSSGRFTFTSICAKRVVQQNLNAHKHAYGGQWVAEGAPWVVKRFDDGKAWIVSARPDCQRLFREHSSPDRIADLALQGPIGISVFGYVLYGLRDPTRVDVLATGPNAGRLAMQFAMRPKSEPPTAAIVGESLAPLDRATEWGNRVSWKRAPYFEMVRFQAIPDGVWQSVPTLVALIGAGDRSGVFAISQSSIFAVRSNLRGGVHFMTAVYAGDRRWIFDPADPEAEVQRYYRLGEAPAIATQRILDSTRQIRFARSDLVIDRFCEGETTMPDGRPYCPKTVHQLFYDSVTRSVYLFDRALPLSLTPGPHALFTS